MFRDRSTRAETRPFAPAPASHLSDDEWESIAALLRLSGRQKQIVRCIFDGEDEDAMAHALGISAHTVHTHVDRLYRKLGVRSRSEVVVQLFLAYLQASDPGRASTPSCDAAHWEVVY